ncbi:MAG: hypothetical protein AYK18_00660 [Theionarchaea archaeon DG-70]|nr:MAG: hypothetical protein AYK18_00660 [Theionarchaea archaeon DG-70]
MGKKGILKVFISSTYKDLKEARGLLIQGIEEVLEAVAMEKFPPSDESSHKKSIDYLEESNICVFIIEDCYGTVIKNCTLRTDECGECKGDISYTHCEYRRALQAGIPHIVYIIENEILDVLSNVKKFDLESTRESDILGFLKRNNINTSRASLFFGYTIEQLEELEKIAKDKNRGRLEQFKKEIRGLYRHKKISKREDYYTFCEIVLEDLKEKVLEWYKKGKIQFADFAGRREELEELLARLHEKNSVCVVGTGGIGKTSLIQLGLLLEKLSGRKIYALFEEYSYNHTKVGYPFAKKRFHETTFAEQLTLIDVLKLVFKKRYDLEDILRMDRNTQISNLIEELDRENSILFIDDLQDSEKDVRDFVFKCGNNLSSGAVVAGVREKKGCYSTIGPLSGMKGHDLERMILLLAETHSVKKYVKDNLGTWRREISKIAQGHPMLVDIIVKNANVFPDCTELKGITHIKNIEDQEVVNEVMDRLIRKILTNEELEAIRTLSVFRNPVDKGVFDIVGGEKVLGSIIRKGFLNWNRENKLVFTFNVVKELLNIDTQKEHHDIARRYYSEKLRRTDDSEHPDIHVEIIHHLLGMGEFKEAFSLFFSKIEPLKRAARGRVIELSETLSEKASDLCERAFILGFSGNFLLAGKEFSKAERSLIEASEIYRKLNKKNSDLYNSDLAKTLNDLGILYSNTRKFSEAEKIYKEALEIRRAIWEQEPENYALDLAATLNSLGTFYRDTRKFHEAEKTYREALEIYTNLVEKDPVAFKPEFAALLNNLGTFYRDTRKFHEAKEAYKKALEIYMSLAKSYQDVYAPCVAETLNNLGNLYRNIKKFPDAEKAITQALESYKVLARKSLEIYMPCVAETLSNLGNLYRDIQQFDESEKTLKEALRIFRSLVEKHPNVYTSQIAETLNNLGLLYRDGRELFQAEKVFAEALEKYEQMESWFGAAKAAHNLSEITHDKKILEKSRKFLEVAILLTREEKYRYVHKELNENIYLSLLKQDMSVLGVLESLRGPKSLSIPWDKVIPQKELEKAQNYMKFQKPLIENIIEKQLPYYMPSTELPENSLFVYVQALQDHLLFFVIDGNNMNKFKCRKEFFTIGDELLFNLRIQQWAAGKTDDLTFVVDKFDNYSKKWSETLPEELKALIQENDYIIFSPDYYCSYLPLEALQIDGLSLCVEKTVVRATSLQQFSALLKKKPSFDTSLIVGSPWPDCDEKTLVYSPPQLAISFLQGAQEEAEALAKKVPKATLLLKHQATGERFLSEISQHSLIHFCGYIDAGRILLLSGPFKGFPPLFEPEEFSNLRKAERSKGAKKINMMEEWYPVTDLDLLDIPLTDGAIVFLNALGTGPRKYLEENHYQGLPTIFLKNGACSVISLMTPILDKHAKEFAIHFYDNLLETHSVATSLKKARIQVRDNYQAQVSWIPYVHYGSPL